VVTAIIRAVQRVVMAVSLFLGYYLVIGFTFVLALVFQRRLARWPRVGRESYWEPASGYEADPERAVRQT
jgi:hypothetical protein